MPFFHCIDGEKAMRVKTIGAITNQGCGKLFTQPNSVGSRKKKILLKYVLDEVVKISNFIKTWSGCMSF